MFLVLRNIRRRLLDGGQAGRYAAYALGEILLVVIGILIALSIDNWNTQRLEKQELHGYLQNIANNIEEDRSQLESILAFRLAVSANAREITKLAAQERVTFSELQVLTDPEHSIFYDNYLEINQSGFEALKNSGYLGKIQNTRIEKLLNNYYLLVSIVAKYEQSLNNFIENLEVYGFQDRTFMKLLTVFRAPDPEAFVEGHQEEIMALLNSPAIYGANFRGALTGDSIDKYRELLAMGEAIQAEIADILQS